jgi:hypothetical protein
LLPVGGGEGGGGTDDEEEELVETNDDGTASNCMRTLSTLTLPVPLA